MAGDKLLWGPEEVERALRRMTLEIEERNKGLEGLLLMGIQRRGVDLARRLQALFKEERREKVPCGVLDISLYRDDLSVLSDVPVVRSTSSPVDVTGRKVILVDDVLYTGRTVRAALDALADLGRPASVRLAVLIDRGHRELPIQPDFLGKTLPTSRDELVNVKTPGWDGESGVWLARINNE